MLNKQFLYLKIIILNSNLKIIYNFIKLSQINKNNKVNYKNYINGKIKIMFIQQLLRIRI